jgi:hypothetical protein
MAREEVPYTQNELNAIASGQKWRIPLIILLCIVPFIYLAAVSFDISIIGLIFCILLPVATIYSTWVSFKKLNQTLVAKKKIVYRGRVIKRVMHIRYGRNTKSYYYITLEDEGEFEFDSEVIMDRLRFGSYVELWYNKETNELLNANVLEQSNGYFTNEIPQAEAEAIVSNDEKAIIRKDRSKKYKRKSLYIIFFSLIVMPIFWVFLTNYDLTTGILFVITGGPFAFYIWSIGRKHNSDLRCETKHIVKEIIFDKFESDRILLDDNDGVDYPKEKFVYYIIVNSKNYLVSKKQYNSFVTGDLVKMEIAPKSGVVLSVHY